MWYLLGTLSYGAGRAYGVIRVNAEMGQTTSAPSAGSIVASIEEVGSTSFPYRLSVLTFNVAMGRVSAAATWPDWSHVVKIGCKPQYTRSFELLRDAEAEPDIEENLTVEEEKFSFELYEVLSKVCSAEAS